ncbi:MAG: DUF4242 domain-containing protein [Methylococcales bacterium]|nr:DUF4242 domain-containing protein [Methylococcales bacterium]
MPKYIIEREIPNAGQLTTIERQQISEKSCCVLKEMGPKIQWIESYVTDNKVYCIYIAPDKQSIKTHAERGGFPANSIAEVKTMINPKTAEN